MPRTLRANGVQLFVAALGGSVNQSEQVAAPSADSSLAFSLPHYGLSHMLYTRCDVAHG